MHNGDIKSFSLAGKISGDTFIESKRRLSLHIEQQMRAEGYVPHLDLKELFTRSMDADGNFDFELTVYGIHVGEEQSLLIAGITDGKEIMSAKSMTPSK